MNELMIPPSPSWYLCSVLDCASDNTVVYASRKDLIIIKPQDCSEPADIEFISAAHNEKITSVSLNHSTWGDPDKLVVTAGDDKVVRLWDLNKLSLKMLHKEHEKSSDSIVGVAFAGERVISVSETGNIFIWRIPTNKVTSLDILGRKVKIRYMSSCPHASWITAFGLESGVIIVADLRRNGKIINKLFGCDGPVTGLSWCPAPYNIYKTRTGLAIESILKGKSDQKKSKKDQTEPTNQETQDENLTAPTKSETSLITEEEHETIELEIDNEIKLLEEDLFGTPTKKAIEEKVAVGDEDILFEVDIPKYNLEDRLQSEYKKVDKKNPWNISLHESEDETKTQILEENSFLKECDELRETILGNGDSELVEKVQTDTKNTIKLEEETEIHSENHPEHLEKKFDEMQINENENTEEVNIDESHEDDTETQRFIVKNKQDYLLASTSKNGTVLIWRALTDGRTQLILPSASKDKSSRQNHFKWISVCWVKPDILVTSSKTNQVYCWDLLPKIDLNRKHNKSSLFKPRLLHNDHNKQIFSINTPYKVYYDVEETYSWDSLNDSFIWTTSQDRWILCTSLGTERKTLASYPCFTGMVVCMAVSSIDPTKLAIGIYDSFIRIWDLSYRQTQIIKMSSLNESCKIKITNIDWHPVKENLLAFSTSEGTVGEFNVNTSKQPKMYSAFHRNAVNKIQWGPLPENEGEYALYSCSGGDFVYHNATDYSADPTEIEILDSRVTTFAWKSDYTVLAVGTKEGHVKLLSQEFIVFQTFYMQRKAVQCVIWHPASTASDSGLSPYANYLAVSTNECNIFVYDCSNMDNDAGDTNKLIAELKGHNSSVKMLAWCPQIGGKLVSCSENGIVMVWDVISQTLLSTYKDNRRSVSTLLWSPLDADLIICGGKDSIIRIFRISKYPPVIYEDDKKDKKKKAINTAEKDDDDIKGSIEEEKVRKLYVLPEVTKYQNREHGYTIETCKKLLKLHDKTEEETNSDDESSSDDETADIGENFEVDPVLLFGSRKDMKTILNYEQETHISKHRWESTHHLSLWRGDLLKSLERALKTGVITPWIINMAPMVSHKLWSDLCLKYAEKLSEDGNGLMASSYFLACHQIGKAIEVLCKSNMHREALAVAKCRLPSNDPIITSIYEQWASYASYVGCYEIAAQCYIKLGNLSEAAILLNKRSDIETLEMAGELARRSNNNDLQIAVNAKLEILNLQKVEQTEQNSTNEDNQCSVINIAKSRFDAVIAGDKKEDKSDDKPVEHSDKSENN